MQAEIRVSDIVHPGVLSCAAGTPVTEAARLMADARYSSILIDDGGKIVGIWTEQDALALDLSDPDLYRLPISQFMSSPVKTLDIDIGIGEASLRFREEGVRHFLVVDAAKSPIGVVSQTDIVINQGIEYFISLREVSAVFNRRQPIVHGAVPMRDAVLKMRQERLDAIIVHSPERGYGILTERDVVRLIATGRPLSSVAESASYPLIALPANSSLYHARKLFIEKHIRHLGVTGNSGELLGLVTFADILANIEHEYVRHLREALRENQASLAASNHHLRLAAKAFESTIEGIMVTNAGSVIESVNPAFTQITGYAAHEVIGKTPSLLSSGRHDENFYREMYETLAGVGCWQGEICNRRKNGEVYIEWLSINAVKDNDGKVTNYVAVFSDFTSRKEAEEQIRFLAQHDALTGLPNRTLLRERLLRAIPHARRNDRKLAVIFLDLNDFKVINDTLGHDVGDQTLKIVAERLIACVRAEDTVSRLGGDEFILVLEEIVSDAAVPAIVEKIVDAISQPMLLAGREMRVSTSIGISLYPHDGDDPDELLKNADAAMYKAKEQGRSAFHFFSGR